MSTNLNPHLAKAAPALLGFLFGMAIGLSAIADEAKPAAAPAEPAKVGDCATNQPELRKLFPVEMRILKNFEGIFSNISYKKTPDLQSRSYSFNANKKVIQIQSTITNDVGDRVTSKPLDAKVCKTETGMVIKAEGVEIPLTVLSNREVRLKVGAFWLPFYRIQDAHFNFAPPGNFLFGKTTPEPATDNDANRTGPGGERRDPAPGQVDSRE